MPTPSRTMYEDAQKSSTTSDSNELSFDVLMTTYGIALMDQDFLSQIPWHYAVIDEAQRLKNPSSVLYNVLEQRFIMPRCLLLTGTPTQNNLSELWALMHFCLPLIFGKLDEFLSTFNEAGDSMTGAEANKANRQFKILKHILKACMLRRTKALLIESGILALPPLTELTVMVPLTQLQKKLYLSVLRKELQTLLSFIGGSSCHQSLQNIVIQLRKACSHPYLFSGIEPEPYVEGEHLVEASRKLIVLDLVLKKLHDLGNRVLLFAQMTQTLDILQDFPELCSYTYERLDGSVRAEERFAAIRNFSSQSTKGLMRDDNRSKAFVFMISTRAGGVGLNLIGADTVSLIELDSVVTLPVLLTKSKANCSGSFEAPLWVALAIVQSYNPRRKVPRSEISMPDLELCLSKAAFSAALRSASIHMPRIGYQGGSQRSEWYTIERLLRKHSSLHGINIFVYYFQRSSRQQTYSN
ncbi:LOW QUALITY PROTEIN: probable helicase CHR10 [Phragmites australis]|uniref:LOW QUALITY PROTEIN: probable helicase CHR10 n=1 Tax=Phragmites australis TaxID=29695 RepID=UPI002D78F133|nr:LOW QUALITY PROTEIN: probable helicase CHR10 [Phragmites australis]